MEGFLVYFWKILHEPMCMFDDKWRTCTSKTYRTVRPSCFDQAVHEKWGASNSRRAATTKTHRRNVSSCELNLFACRMRVELQINYMLSVDCNLHELIDGLDHADKFNMTCLQQLQCHGPTQAGIGNVHGRAAG